ncbi:MAG TPA: fimbrial protein [Scandinavium sp.]|jgi:type 1 fimbria pilin|uniref:fimbrial protein n=1 Tax=Scandinavium sp. TaxID=2830653 RepID=UPI002E381B35|nr:fimbrial protein [Scandinavium sp.]HEX4501797.1 fimbrial protein [Scandinavium sp.]
MKTIISGSLHWLRNVAVITVILLSSTYATACEISSLPALLTINIDGEIHKDISTTHPGDVLYVKRGSLSMLSHVDSDIACSSATGQLMFTGVMAANMVGDHIYPTSLTGVGIRIHFYLRHANASPQVFPFTLQSTLQADQNLTTRDILFKIELVRTAGGVGTESLNFQQPSLLTINDTGSKRTTLVNFVLNASVPAAYCQLDVQNKVIALPSLQMSGVVRGMKNGVRPLNVTLRCTGGITQASLTVFGKIYDASQGILALRKQPSSAQGIGLQLFYDQHPLHLGEPLSLNIPQIDGQSQTLPLAAGYARTEGSVSPGRVDSIVFLKVDYL